jgi:pyridoxine 4-dehydrogenase
MEQQTGSFPKTFKIAGVLEVSRLGYGAMRLTGPGVWGEPRDRESAVQVLKLAIQLGVNFIDTADSYGPEVSERLIAEALYPYSENLVIATKGGIVRPGPGRWQPDGRPEYLREACEGSLNRLRLETIPLYQLHAPDPVVPYADSIGVLTDMQREGKIRYIGVSNVDSEELAIARSIAEIVSVQNRYNYEYRASDPIVDECERAGIAFIPWFPLNTGGLSRAYGRLSNVAQLLGATPSQVALAWLLSRSPCVLPIPGTTNPAHLRENCKALDLMGRTEITGIDQQVAA